MSELLQDIAAAIVGIALIVAALVVAVRPGIVETISRHNQEITQGRWGLMTDSDYDRERKVMKILMPAFMFFLGAGFLTSVIR